MQRYTIVTFILDALRYRFPLAYSSRCFSHCPYALTYAGRLFVYEFNHRQLHQRRYPNYHFHIADFVYSLH